MAWLSFRLPCFFSFPKFILTDGTALLLCQAAHDGNHDLAFGIQCIDVLFLKIYLDYHQLVVIESYFDTGNRPSGVEPERFYHGFVLGLMVDLEGKYIITSNRESGPNELARLDGMM